MTAALPRRQGLARLSMFTLVVLGLFVVLLTDRQFSWLAWVGSQAAFPWRGLFLQILYIGSPWVMVLLALVGWLRFQRISIAWLLLVIPGILFFTQWLTAPWTDWPDNYISPVVAACWCLAGASVRLRHLGWLSLLISLVVVAGLSVQALSWEWVGVQFLFGLFLGGLVEWPYRLLFLMQTGHKGVLSRKARSSNPLGSSWAEPVW